MVRNKNGVMLRGRNSIVNGRAVASFPVKPCGLHGRLSDGNLPHLVGTPSHQSALGQGPFAGHGCELVSVLEGYAQFSDFISSDDPVIETRPGFEPIEWRHA